LKSPPQGLALAGLFRVGLGGLRASGPSLHITSTANPSTKVNGVTYHRLSLSDSASSSISKIADAACEIIDGAITSKKDTGKILVHCSAGISRSPTVVAAYLMKQKGMTLKAALGKIVHVRPQISPNPGFLQQLKKMEVELYGSCSLEVDEFPKQEKDWLSLFEEPQEQPKKGTEGTAAKPVRMGYSAFIAAVGM